MDATTQVMRRDDGTIYGYIVLYSDEFQLDLLGQYYSQATALTWDETQALPIRVFGLNDELVDVGVSTLVVKDEIGIRIEAKLDSTVYLDPLFEMIDMGIYYWGSGSDPAKVEFSLRGDLIEAWPLEYALLTVTPALMTVG